MFTSTLRATFIALASLAIAVSASPSLSLKVTGVNSVQHVDNFKVKTIITNTGDETLKILNDPRGPLSKLPTNTFTITNAQGVRPSFSGMQVKYVPSAAAAQGAYTVLQPGKSIEVEHSLGEAYNFEKPGEGSYNITPSNTFYIIDSSSNIIPIHAESTASSHKVSLTGRLSAPRLSTSTSPTSTGTKVKRANWVGCSSSQQSTLLTAASNAQSYASNALSYLNSHTSSTPRFTTWFGTFTSNSRNTVTSHFTSISGRSFSSFTYDCSCTDAGLYAFVYANECGTIHICPGYWNAPATGTDSKAGTLVHESSHWSCNGGTGDYVYGQSGAKSLAISNPGQAIMNADSHEFFAENTPALS